MQRYKGDNLASSIIRTLVYADLFDYPLILEEVDELKAEVWKKPRLRDKVQMRKEATQVAATAMRFLIELC